MSAQNPNKAGRPQNNDGEMLPDIIKAAKLNSISLAQAALSVDPYSIVNTTREGDTALHVAVNFGNLSMVEFLVDQPYIDLSRTNNRGVDPLDLAITIGHPGVIKILFQRRAAELGMSESDDEPSPGTGSPVIPFKPGGPT